MPFVVGHRESCRRIDFSDAIPFKIEGVYCKLIQLTKGLFTIVDAADHEWLSQRKWLAYPSTPPGCFYVARVARARGAHRLEWMHREILGLCPNDEREGDHIQTRDTLDNRRANLRIATGQQNQHNRMKYRRNSSGFKGVSWHPHTKQYAARIRVNGELINLGYRKTAQAAHEELYVPAALKYHGDFARTA